MNVEITLVNENHGTLVYKGIEDWDAVSSPSEVYHAARKEYGKPTSAVYIDDKEGKTHKIGWTFQKRKKYTYCRETYLQTAWIVPVEVTPQKVNPVLY
jgi:hypothetical protein